MSWKRARKRNKNGKLATVAYLMLNDDWLKFCAALLHIRNMSRVMWRKVPLNIYFFILVWKPKSDTFRLNGRDFCQTQLLLTWKLVNECVWMNLKLFLQESSLMFMNQITTTKYRNTWQDYWFCLHFSIVWQYFD